MSGRSIANGTRTDASDSEKAGEPLPSIFKEDVSQEITEFRRMLSAAYQRHWQCLDRIGDDGPYLSYELINAIQGWNFTRMGGALIGSEFREVINGYNAWLHRLKSWCAWNEVLNEVEGESDAWDIRYEFVEPLAFFCLHQPTVTRDRLTRFLTMVVHMGNLSTTLGYKDRLMEDERVFKRLQRGHAKPYDYFLPRGEAERQLMDISSNWPSAAAISGFAWQLDNDEYREITCDWRNKAAHDVAPHFEFGDTKLVRRHVMFHEHMQQRPDGAFDVVVDRSKMTIAYGFGGTAALRMVDVYEANKAQCGIARSALEACENLLQDIGAQLPISK